MYNTIVINGWEITFRFRDDNRIKVGKVSRVVEFEFENKYDDCSGEEFLTLLQSLKEFS